MRWTARSPTGATGSPDRARWPTRSTAWRGPGVARRSWCCSPRTRCCWAGTAASRTSVSARRPRVAWWRRWSRWSAISPTCWSCGPTWAPTRLVVVFGFNTDLFDRETVDGLARRFEVLLTGAVADPDRPISRLPLLADDEVDRLHAWGTGAVAQAPPETVLEQVARHAADAP